MADYIGTQLGTGYPAQNKFPSTNTAWGATRILQDPTQIFLDTFDTAIDTNQWTATSGGGGVTPAYSGASVTLNSGTTINGWSLFQSIPTHSAQEPGWLTFACRVNIETPVLTSGYRFWGFGTVPGSPTISAPMSNGVGFEILPDGKLYAVTYASGNRNFISDLSAATGNGSQPGNARAHKYYIWFRPDLTFWAIDQQDNIVALFSTGASGPDVNNLPMSYLAVAGAGTAVTIINNGCSIGDTSRNNLSLSDSVYGWKQARILTGGELLTNNAVGSYPSAPTNVTSAASDTAIAAANANRRMLIVSNDSTSKLYLLVDPSGAGVASATNFTYVIAAGGTFEFPNPVSTARVRGIWAAANGSAGVTDISNTTTLGGA